MIAAWFCLTLVRPEDETGLNLFFFFFFVKIQQKAWADVFLGKFSYQILKKINLVTNETIKRFWWKFIETILIYDQQQMLKKESVCLV